MTDLSQVLTSNNKFEKAAERRNRLVRGLLNQPLHPICDYPSTFPITLIEGTNQSKILQLCAYLDHTGNSYSSFVMIYDAYSIMNCCMMKLYTCMWENKAINQIGVALCLILYTVCLIMKNNVAKTALKYIPLVVTTDIKICSYTCYFCISSQ